MQKTKATGIGELSEVVKVPDFRIIRRGEALSGGLDESKQYMVRNSADVDKDI